MAKRTKGRKGKGVGATSPVAEGQWPPIWIALALVASVAFTVYVNALSNGLVWDDPIIVERQLVVFDSISDILITPRGIPHYSPDYYRPTTTVSYLLDHWLGGGEAFPFHLSVLVAHAAVSVLVTLLCLQLVGGAAVVPATLAGLLFALHPIHTESVAWAAGRSDVLASGFAVGVLVLLGGREVTALRMVASGVCAFAALGAKEVAVTLYPLLLLRDFLDPEVRLGKDQGKRYIGVGVALLVYVVLRRATIGEVVGEQPGEASMVSVLPSMFWALGGYVRELVWPFPLNAYIDVVPRGMAGAIGFLGLVGLLVWASVRWRGGDWRWLFASLWIPIAIAPSLAILWKIPEVPLAERYAYMPSIGLSLLVAITAANVRRPLAQVLAVAVPVLLGAAVAVWLRTPVWHDDISLWEDTVDKTEVSGMAWRSLGAAYLRAGRHDDAEVALHRALELRNPRLGLQGIHSNLGTIAMHRQDFVASRRAYERALEATPDAPDVIFNLGLSILYGGGQSPASAREALPHFSPRSRLESARSRHRRRSRPDLPDPRRRHIGLDNSCGRHWRKGFASRRGVGSRSYSRGSLRRLVAFSVINQGALRSVSASSATSMD